MGLEVPAGTEPGQAAFNFFTDIMNIQPQHGDIIFAFTWGNGSMKKTRCGMATIPPQLVVKVTESFKNRVIPNIRTLGKTYNQILLCGYYIKPNHPSEVCAARECLASVVAAAKKENKSKDPDKQMLICYVGTELYIDGQPKTLDVEPPRKMTSLQCSKAFHTKAAALPPIYQINPTVVIQDSIFKGYSMHVNNLQDIKDAYVVMQCKDYAAQHIVMAYVLQDPEDHHKTLTGYCDDGEDNLAKIVLSLLKESALKNAVIFVGRHYQYKIGDLRYKGYRKATKEAITLLQEKDAC